MRQGKKHSLVFTRAKNVVNDMYGINRARITHSEHGSPYISEDPRLRRGSEYFVDNYMSQALKVCVCVFLSFRFRSPINHCDGKEWIDCAALNY